MLGSAVAFWPCSAMAPGRGTPRARPRPARWQLSRMPCWASRRDGMKQQIYSLPNPIKNAAKSPGCEFLFLRKAKTCKNSPLKKQGGGDWEGVSSWLNLFVPKMGCRTWRSAVFSRSWGSTRSMESLVARTWLDSAIAARDEEALQQWLGNYTVPVVSQALVAFARAYATWLYRMYQRLADWTPPCLWGMCRVSNLGCISRARLGS